MIRLGKRNQIILFCGQYSIANKVQLIYNYLAVKKTGFAAVEKSVLKCSSHLKLKFIHPPSFKSNDFFLVHLVGVFYFTSSKIFF